MPSMKSKKAGPIDLAIKLSFQIWTLLTSNDLSPSSIMIADGELTSMNFIQAGHGGFTMFIRHSIIRIHTVHTFTLTYIHMQLPLHQGIKSYQREHWSKETTNSCC